MNKQELIAAVAASQDISKKQAQSVLESIVNTIVGAIVAGDTVSLTGLGTFGTQETAAREGRNPATGAPLSIPASKKPTFKYTAPVKAAVKATVPA